MQITTIGLDIAKNVFQVHGINASEKVVVRKQVRRSQVLEFFKALPPCLVGMEACATAHYWARELTKLGHQVRLMPAKCVSAWNKGSDAILMTDQLAESVFVESIQQHSVSIGERLLPSQRRMPYH
jgi:transposase